MAYRRPPRRFTPEALKNMRFRYEDTDEPQQSIADDYGIHRKTLDRIARDEGWTLRRYRLPRDVPTAFRIEVEAERALREREAGWVATCAPLDAEYVACPHPNPPPQAGEGVERDAQAKRIESKPDAPLSVADRLEQAVEQELAAVERKRMFLGARPESVADGEKTARTLASLTDTLHKIRRLRLPDAPVAGAPPEQSHDDLPADIDEFRHALARRIEAFVRSRSGAVLASTGDAAGGDPPRS